MPHRSSDTRAGTGVGAAVGSTPAIGRCSGRTVRRHHTTTAHQGLWPCAIVVVAVVAVDRNRAAVLGVVVAVVAAEDQ